MTYAKCLARVKRAVDAVSSLPFSFPLSTPIHAYQPLLLCCGSYRLCPQGPCNAAECLTLLPTHTHTHTPLYITGIKDMASLSPNLAQFLNHPKFPLVQMHFSMMSHILKS